MSLITDLRTYLLAQSGVSDLIGSKLQPIRATQAGTTAQSGQSTPYVTYQVIDDMDEVMLESAAGFADVRVQLTAWSTSYATAHAIGAALREELLGMGNTVIGTTSLVYSVRHGGTVDMPEAPQDGSDVGHYGVASDYQILYRSGIPTF